MYQTFVRFSLLLVLLAAASMSFSQIDVIVGPASIQTSSSKQDKDKVVGLTPAQTRRAYGFDRVANQGAGQTVGIVVAFDNPSIHTDLAFFNQTFGLPPCTIANGCLKIVGNPSPPNSTFF